MHFPYNKSIGLPSFALVLYFCHKQSIKSRQKSKRTKFQKMTSKRSLTEADRVCIKMVENDFTEGQMQNIFDLNDVSDIPTEIKNELNRDVFGEQIVELFKLAQRELSVDEVTVGYFRKFNEIKTKKQIMTKLYNMSRDNLSCVRSVPGRKGVYCIEQQAKAFPNSFIQP